MAQEAVTGVPMCETVTDRSLRRGWALRPHPWTRSSVQSVEGAHSLRQCTVYGHALWGMREPFRQTCVVRAWLRVSMLISRAECSS